MATRNLCIMFTDIKGFTSRTSKQTRKEINRLLDEHNRLLIPVFNYFDGTIVKTIGDAFLVWFESPTDAVLCGVTIQEVLNQYNQTAPEDDKLDIRVAINVGDVELKDNDILGEPVNIAARLEGISEAGEVYFTEAVYQTMNRHEAPSSEVGERIFKGIPHPIRVYKVIRDPNSILAQNLAEGVQLSDEGPVFTGLREVVAGRKSSNFKKKLVVLVVVLAIIMFFVWLKMPSTNQRVIDSAQDLIEKKDYLTALATIDRQFVNDPTNDDLRQYALQAARKHLVNLVDAGLIPDAIKWLRGEITNKSYLQELSGEVAILEARVAVNEVLQDKKYRNDYYPAPIKKVINQYPTNADVPYTCADLLMDKWHKISILWLYNKALERGGYHGDNQIFDFCVSILTSGQIDSDKFRKSDAILSQFYPERRIKWAESAIESGGALAVRNAWKVLVEVKDPRSESQYYKMLYELVRDNQTDMDIMYEVFLNQTPVDQQQHLVNLHQEMAASSPSLTIYRDKKSAALVNLQKLKNNWGTTK
jgi:class 3 adenylate cyclase